MHITGTYQGMDILDGEFSLRVGVEPSRGWVRILLSEMGGALPLQANIDQMREQFNRAHRPTPYVQRAFLPFGQHTTVTTKMGQAPPKPFTSMGGLWGDLILETNATGSGASTTVKIKNIFWIEAVIERQDIADGDQYNPSGDSVVKIELADERFLWDLGGYIMGRRNWLLNDLTDSVAGKIFDWNPTIENPKSTKESTSSTTDKDTSRPILDPRSLYKLAIPYTINQILFDCSMALPGPPQFTVSGEGKIVKTAPYNLDYGGGTLAKTALQDLLNRFNLVIAPDYNGGFQIYERGESSRQNKGEGVIKDPFGGIPSEFMSEGSFPKGAAGLQYKPLCVEVIGERIVDEIACPHWIMVIKDDGIQTEHDASGFSRKVGKWVKADEYLKDIGYSLEKASISLMANYEMHQSKVYDDVPIDDKEKKQKVKATLRKHLFKSFMVAPLFGGTASRPDGTAGGGVGSMGFRAFLPMILKRPGTMSHALNMPGMAIGRDATFFSDGWTPSQIRKVGTGPFYGNQELEQVDADDIGHIDPLYGVISFKEPRGTLAYLSKYLFEAGGGFVQAVVQATFDIWKNKANALAGKIQEQYDNAIYKLGDSTHYYDLTGPLRVAMQEFKREVAKSESPVSSEIVLSEHHIAVLSANVIQNFSDQAPIFGNNPALSGSKPNFNLSEFKLVEPRILGIWGWERNYGRSDDYYRFRGGVDTTCPAYPLHVRGLHQYIDHTGATNKEVLDILAQMNVDEFLEKRETALEGATLKYAGFYPVALSGAIPEVAWRFSLQGSPSAETEIHVNRFQHGIKGRPAAVSTWSAAQKPLPYTGMAER